MGRHLNCGGWENVTAKGVSGQERIVENVSDTSAK